MEDSGDSKFFYFLTGLGMGALIGILFAPQAGEKTRELIASKAEEGRDYLRNRGQELRNQAADYVERGKDVLAEQRDHLTAAVEAGKQAYRAESKKGTS
jgi:gas vesicle protein